MGIERHGSWGKGKKVYWKTLVHVAHHREKTTMEFPTPESVLTRRVLQSLAIALWRVNAAHILQFHRRALFGAQRHDGSDAEVPAAGARAGH